MNTLLRDVSEQNNQAEYGTTRLMMVNKIEDHFFSWYADNMKTVVVQTPSGRAAVKLGDFVSVKIISTESLKLFAEMV